MLRNGKDDSPPSYSESWIARGQKILDQLSLTRARHIQSVIDTHILPMIEQQASYGIAQTVIALLPSDIPLSAPEEKSEFSFESLSQTKPVELIGFPSEEEPIIIPLTGRMNRTEFWRPQDVIVELERVLRETLNASTQLRSPTNPARFAKHDFDHVNQHNEQVPARKLFSRKMAVSGNDHQSSGKGPDSRGKPQQGPGSVLVKVRLEEVSLRTVNDFGLYDTLSRQCIIVRVDARC